MKYLIPLLLICSFTRCSPNNSTLLYEKINSIIADKNATIGVAIKQKGKNKIISINNEHHYPMLSVYKFHLALAVSDYLDKNTQPLLTEMLIDKADLLPDTHSPLRDQCPEGSINMSIAELLKYTVSLSDNNTCDILIKYIGGINEFDKYINSLSIDNIEIVATEEKMHERFENQYLNWTTPSAAVQLLDIFFEKDLFGKVYKEFLINIMIETQTGADKIKALLPNNVVVGHKTGSSFRNENGIKAAENDIAFVQLPNGKQYYIAIFVTDSAEDDKTNAAIIAEISKIVYEYFTN